MSVISRIRKHFAGPNKSQAIHQNLSNECPFYMATFFDHSMRHIIDGTLLGLWDTMGFHLQKKKEKIKGGNNEVDTDAK